MQRLHPIFRNHAGFLFPIATIEAANFQRSSSTLIGVIPSAPMLHAAFAEVLILTGKPADVTLISSDTYPLVLRPRPSCCAAEAQTLFLS